MRSIVSAVLCTTLLTSSGCSSGRGAREAPVVRPEMRLVLTSLLGANGRQAGPVEVHFQVLVKNNSSGPITLRQLDIRTVSSGAYTLNSNSIVLNHRVAGLTTSGANFHARGYGGGGVVGASEPALLRVIAYFESDEGPFHHVFTQRVDPFESNRRN